MRITRLLVVGAAVLAFGFLAVGCGPGGGNGGNDAGGLVGQDGGGVTDGGTTSDGGTVTDGGTTTDAGTPNDGGTVSDGGTVTDGGTPADGGTCAVSPCAIVAPQCGCTGTQACYPNGTAHVCAPAGTATEGASCTNMNDCAAGLGCLNIAQSGARFGVCERFCNGDGDCQGTGSMCVHTVTDPSGATVATVCSLACDPIAQTGCASGAECVIAAKSSGSSVFFTDCVAPVGTATQGQSCTGIASCAPGYACAGSPSTCMKYCTAPGQAGAGGCSASQTCYALGGGVTIGGTNYGVCN